MNERNTRETGDPHTRDVTLCLQNMDNRIGPTFASKSGDLVDVWGIFQSRYAGDNLALTRQMKGQFIANNADYRI